MRETPLDRAAARAGAEAATDGGVFDALFNSEMHLLLAAEAEGDVATPRLVALADGPAAVAFDRADRLAAFSGDAAPFAAMPGRALVRLLAGRGVSLAVNPGVAPSELFYGPEALDWAAGVLAGDFQAEEARGAALGPPRGATQALLAALDAKLAALAPALEEAWLAGTEAGLLLVLRLAPGGSERGAARALAETARLAGADAPPLDIAVVEAGAALLARARAVGLGFEPPRPERASGASGPGRDPARPPRLR